MGNYTQLSLTERRQLHAFLDMKLSLKEIAIRLRRHRSTIYREINRNQEHDYFPVVAHQKAHRRNKNGRGSKITTDGVLRDYVLKGLKKGWSPEQISGRMKHQEVTFYACAETIYQYIYGAHDKTLYHYLPNKKPKRRRRYVRKVQICRFGKMRLITQRPEPVNTRTRFGHWEGDTIAFTGTKNKVVTTLVERKSRMVYLLKNNSKHSRGVMDKIKQKFDTLPVKMFKTITFDQGSEFADYCHLEQQARGKVFYCEAHSPWQKGSNENMNGRLRRYLPRATNIAEVTQEELDRLAEKMNHCPRKCIGYKTPNEVFIQQHKNDCRTWD